VNHGELAYTTAVAAWRRRSDAAAYDPPVRSLSTIDQRGNVILRNGRGTLAWVRASRTRTTRSHPLTRIP
jgi:hypothetical protein